MVKCIKIITTHKPILAYLPSQKTLPDNHTVRNALPSINDNNEIIAKVMCHTSFVFSLRLGGRL